MVMAGMYAHLHWSPNSRCIPVNLRLQGSVIVESVRLGATRSAKLLINKCLRFFILRCSDGKFSRRCLPRRPKSLGDRKIFFLQKTSGQNYFPSKATARCQFLFQRMSLNIFYFEPTFVIIVAATLKLAGDHHRVSAETAMVNASGG